MNQNQAQRSRERGAADVCDVAKLPATWNSISGCILALFVGLAIGSTDGRAAERISFELATSPTFGLQGRARWIELFRELELTDIRIRSGQASDRPLVENQGTEASPRYHVIGLLTDRNRLVLPGGEFGLTDREGLKQWVGRLRSEGAEGLTAKRGLFGLTKEQIVKVDEQLQVKVPASTSEQRVGDVVRTLVKLTTLEFQVSAGAQAVFAKNTVYADELQGVACGAALAAVLTGQGLAFAPQSTGGGRVGLKIATRSELREAWPVGWPPSDSPFKVAPPLYEYLTVEIQETPIAVALDAIQPRVQVPFLLDYAAIQRHEIDLATKQVSFPRGRTLYRRLLDKLLFDAGLKSDLRVDEAGQPLVWITTIKP